MTQPWLERDPELTQPGPRPTVSPALDALPEPDLPRRRGRRLAVLTLVGLVALAVGGGAGYAAQRGVARASAPSPTTTARSPSPSRSAGTAPTPPRAGPPNGDGQQFAALSVGLPAATGDQRFGGGRCPPSPAAGHGRAQSAPPARRCDTPGRVVRDTQDGNESATTVYFDCPGGGPSERTVLVEWHAPVGAGAQCRPGDGNQVLDDVETTEDRRFLEPCHLPQLDHRRGGATDQAAQSS